MKKMYLLLIVLNMTALSFGQLTGIKTIPGDYATVSAAISALNTAGVGAGGVTFNVAAGFTETFASNTAGYITTVTGSASNPIVFQKSGSGADPLITAPTGIGTMDAIIAIAGCDYVTFNGIDLLENAANITTTTQMEWGYAVLKASATDGSQNTTIKNCTITLNKTNTATYGIYSNNHTTAAIAQLTVTAASGTNSGNKFFNNVISNSYGGIYIYGYADLVSPYNYYDQNNEIGVGGANTITNFGGAALAAYAIYTSYQNGSKIANNSINGGTGTTGAVYGIYSGSATSANADIYNNNLTMTSGGTTAALYGIYNASGSTATTNTVNIYNNTLSNWTYATATSAIIYMIYNAATPLTVNMYGNIVTNCTFPSTGTQYCIYSTSVTNTNIYSNEVGGITKTLGGTLYAIYAATGTISLHDNNIHNLTESAGGNAIYGFYDLSSPTIETYYNNTFNNFTNSGTGGLFGIYTNTAAGIRNVYSNTVYTFNAAGGGPIYGLYGASSSPNYYKNRIYDLTSGTAGGLIYGLYLTSAAGAANIYNNYISDLKTPAATGLAAIAGIYIGGGTNVGVYDNTIYMNASSAGATFGTTGIYASTTPTVDIRNNIVVNTSTAAGAGGYTVAYRRSSSTLTTYANTSNTNDFYAGTPSATNVIYYDGTTTQQTMAAYKTLVSPRDAQSFTENPPFVNIAATPYNLHLQTTIATQCESGGAVVSSPLAITTDFDNDARYPNAGYPNNIASPASAPDVGADEFAGLSLDLTPPSVSFTAFGNTSSTTARTLTTTITDGTGVPTSGIGLPRLYWKINAGSWQTAIGTFVSGSTYTFTFGAGVVLGDVVSYYIVSQDIVVPTPNVGATPGAGAAGLTINPPAAATPPTTPYSYTIVGSLCGTYNVGVGQTYTTITAAMADLAVKEVTCPVTFVLTDATYSASETFPIVVFPIAGSSPVNTVTLKPASGVTPTITGSSTSGIFVLWGTNYFVIDGSNTGGSDKSLTWENTNTASNTYTLGIFNTGTAPASNDVIKNCLVRASSQVSNNTFGILLNALVGGYNNIVINNNTIYSARYGLQFAGVSGTPATNGQITNNIIGSTVDAQAVQYYGIVLSYADNTLIQGNEIMGASLGNTNTYQAGIYLSTGATNTQIKRNKIHDWYYTGTSGYGCFGIYYYAEATSPSEITNNLIYAIKSDGDPSGQYYDPAGIFMRTGGNCKIYHNSINMTGTTLSSSYLSYSSCISIYTGITTLDIRNNILKNSMQPISGSGNTTYAIYSASANTAFTPINYNDYFVDGINAKIGYLGAAQATLAAWQTATAQDANSLNLDPAFVSATDLHPTAVGLMKTGIAIPTVLTDYAGNARTNPPDIGAYQYSSAPAIITIAASAITTTTATLNGSINANNATVISGFDYGLTTAYGTSVAATPASVTGAVVTGISQPIAGLTPGTLYHFRAKGTSASVFTGGDLTFTTPAIPPAVVTTSATGVTGTTATINGTVNANGNSTNVTFDYGLTIAYGTTVPGVPSPVTGAVVTPVSANLSGLLPGTLYHYRVNGTNAGGTANGSDLTFTTPALAPTAVTTAATGLGSTTATLNGTITANGASTTVTFDYGLTLAYGTTVPGLPSPVNGNIATAVSASISGLSLSTTYHYRVNGVNSIGTTNGNDMTFTTGCPVAGPAGPITGPTQVCQGGCGYVYSVAPIANASGYVWTLPIGGSITAGNNTNSITVCYNATASPGYVFVYGTAACGNGSPSQLSVAMNAPASPTITGPASVCLNSTGNVYTTQAGMTNYVWIVSAGGTITAGGGLNNNTVTVTWSTTGAKTVCVNYNNAAGCPALAPVCYTVTVNALPVITISGPSPACANYPGLIYSTQAGMTNYIWSISAGGTITAGGTSTSSTATVTWNTTGAQSISVNYNNANGCSATVPLTYPVTVNSGAAPTITGSTNVCINSGYYNYTTEAGMTAYIWTVSPGGLINFGSGTNMITVSWIISGPQWVKVNYTNPGGCQAFNPTQLNVTVNPLPDAAGTITGTGTVCGGATGIAYSIAPVANAVSYVWTLPAGATIASGAGTNAITVNFAPNAASGNITVYANNICGNGAVSPVFLVVVNPLPDPAGTITGTSSVCAGATGVAYTVAAIAGADGYNWTVPAGATIASGSNTNSITVDFPTALSGVITVAGTNTCGNGTVSPGFNVTVNSIPSAPVITLAGNMLSSDAPSGNQWYFEGTLLSGATAQTYLATQSGHYWDVVTLNGCSSDTSNHLNVVIIGVQSMDNQGISIYPVPNDGQFTVSMSGYSNEIFTISVYNNLGIKIFEKQHIEVNGTLNQVIDLRPVPDGVYTVTMENAQKQVVKRIVVNK